MPSANLPSTDTRKILAALNKALKQVNPRIPQRLHLSHFARVSFADYEAILEVESFAIDAGYPELN